MGSVAGGGSFGSAVFISSPGLPFLPPPERGPEFEGGKQRENDTAVRRRGGRRLFSKAAWHAA